MMKSSVQSPRFLEPGLAMKDRECKSVAFDNRRSTDFLSFRGSKSQSHEPS